MGDVNLTQEQVDQIVQSNIAIQVSLEHSNKRMDDFQEALTEISKTVSDIHVVQNEVLHINTRVDETNAFVKKVNDKVTEIDKATDKNTDASKKFNLLIWLVFVSTIFFCGATAIQFYKQESIDYEKLGKAIAESVKDN